MKNETKRKVVVISIELILGLLHIIGIGRNSSEEMFILSASYFSDLALPFGFYFLLKFFEERSSIFRKWWVKASIIFSLATSAEIMQYFGVYALGRTFDPVDILVYAMGVSLAALFDFLFSKAFSFWSLDTTNIKEV